MIVKVVKETPQKDPLFDAYLVNVNGKQKVCQLFDVSSDNEQIMEFHFVDKKEYVYFSLFTQKAKGLRKKYNIKAIQASGAYFVLNESKDYIGRFVCDNQKLKGHLLLSYPCTTFVYNNVTYTIWKVGTPKIGLYYVIYENDILVAIIQYTYPEKYGDPLYTLYSEKDNIELLLFVGYCHFTENYGYDTYSRSSNTIWTAQKEILAKYDPDFIPRIKAMDGVTD